MRLKMTDRQTDRVWLILLTDKHDWENKIKVEIEYEQRKTEWGEELIFEVK